MRIERTGDVDPLTPRVTRFFLEALSGVALDDVQDPQARKVDYACLNGLLAIELKTLEDDGSERMDNLTDKLRKRSDWPLFYGSWPIESVLKHVGEPELVRRQVAERVGRAIENHIHKANKQLAAHAADFPRKNLVGMVMLVNEDHPIYDPETVAYTVQRLLRRQENGQLLYPNIDAVMYLSERHAARVNELVAFPMLVLEGASMSSSPWKRQITDLVVTRWGRWNGVPTFDDGATAHKFSTIDHIPGKMRRQEAWELEYRRDPYMAGFTDEQVRERFDEAMCINSLAFIKDSPLKPAKDAVEWSMKCMSHLMIEMGRRSISMPECSYEPKRLAEAARRLRLPSSAITWFENDLGRAA
jgi:hypothetical protein